MESMKARRPWTDVLETLRDQGLYYTKQSFQPDYYTQQSFKLPSMEKTRYSMTNPDLNNTYPPKSSLTESTRGRTPAQRSLL